MIRRTWHAFVLLVVAGSAMFSWGCAGTSPPARFYTLSAVETSDTAAAQAGIPAAGIGVGPLSIPDYLDRQQMVVRSGRNEIQVAEYHLWAGALQDEILRILTTNLGRLLSSDRVHAFPWSRSQLVGYTIPLRISQFDGALGGKVFLRAQWTVLDSSKKVVLTRESALEEAVGGNEYADLAAAHSKALERLGREIASAVAGLP